MGHGLIIVMIGRMDDDTTSGLDENTPAYTNINCSQRWDRDRFFLFSLSVYIIL